MLVCFARSPDVSTVDHVRGIIERQLECHLQPSFTVHLLYEQGQKTWNSMLKSDIWHKYEKYMYVCMLEFKTMAISPVINVQVFRTWNGFPRPYINLRSLKFNELNNLPS